MDAVGPFCLTTIEKEMKQGIDADNGEDLPEVVRKQG